MVVLAASISGDYQDTSVALVLRRLLARNGQWQREEVGVGAESLYPFAQSLPPSPATVPSSWALGTFLLPVNPSGPYLSAGSSWSLLHTELQGLGEERVDKVVYSGHKGLVEGSLKFRKLRQGLRAVDAERATCPFSLGHQPAGQHLSGCCHASYLA